MFSCFFVTHGFQGTMFSCFFVTHGYRSEMFSFFFVTHGFRSEMFCRVFVTHCFRAPKKVFLLFGDTLMPKQVFFCVTHGFQSEMFSCFFVTHDDAGVASSRERGRLRVRGNSTGSRQKFNRLSPEIQLSITFNNPSNPQNNSCAFRIQKFS